MLVASLAESLGKVKGFAFRMPQLGAQIIELQGDFKAATPQ